MTDTEPTPQEFPPDFPPIAPNRRRLPGGAIPVNPEPEPDEQPTDEVE